LPSTWRLIVKVYHNGAVARETLRSLTQLTTQPPKNDPIARKPLDGLANRRRYMTARRTEILVKPIPDADRPSGTGFAIQIVLRGNRPETIKA